MKTVNDIRSEFLNFFAGKGHEIVESASLVPQNDPTLMFTNAGMVQFKNVFTGTESRDYTRAVTSQKCVRAGGKHNDLENVGYTARHHTFFEMLGNFSFGDYFKEEAISYAWELLSKNFALPQDKLLITVYSEDEEAAVLWKKIAGFSDDKIIRIPTSDNFWSMGDTGPCGPCSEIFYDHGEDIPGGPPGSPDEDGDRFIEIWNLVFMQYEQFDGGKRVDLPKPSIDTGMGLERMAATMMGSNNNYDVDVLRDIIEHSADLTGIAPDGDQGASHRVIADHLRAAAFLMADGVMPSNEGRGYVLRRIMRRGMRHAHLLGAKEPLMYRLLPTLIGKMGEAYPELKRAEALVKQTLESEEMRFKNTLDRGIKILEEETGKLASGAAFPGDVAFKLYDTFGFPLDLTQDALKDKGIEVDVETFNACMDEQKKAARAAWSGSGEQATEKLWFEILDEAGPTEFLGYEVESAEAVIQAIVKKQYRHPVDEPEANSDKRDLGKGSSEAAGITGPRSLSSAAQNRGDDSFDWVRVDALAEGEEGIIITNQTPFYAESGGQVGDAGVIYSDLGGELSVHDTKKQLGQLVLHYVKCIKRGVEKSEDLRLEIDRKRRRAICSNHSATHLLHEALREILGDHVTQKGSLQDEVRTRFDISHPSAVKPEELARIEALVNEEIRANTKVETRLMPIEEARETGAIALFGEKYDDEVRVVYMGRDGEDKRFSVELCGGTHVKRTGDIGLLKIISEGALASGVRRIEAITGERALDYLSKQESILHDAKAMLRANESDFLLALEARIMENKKLEKEVADLRRKLATSGGGDGSNKGPEVKEIAGVKFTSQVLEGFPAKDLKPMADDLKTRLGSGVIALVATNEGKASIVVGVTDDLTDKMSAVDLVKIGSEALGGKGGGGRPDMAQAGGPNVDAGETAVEAIEAALAG